jgi:hypothetical protein
MPRKPPATAGEHADRQSLTPEAAATPSSFATFKEAHGRSDPAVLIEYTNDNGEVAQYARLHDGNGVIGVKFVLRKEKFAHLRCSGLRAFRRKRAQAVHTHSSSDTTRSSITSITSSPVAVKCRSLTRSSQQQPAIRCSFQTMSRAESRTLQRTAHDLKLSRTFK